MTDKKPTRSLELKIDIDAPIEDAWKAVTEAEGIANWFSPIAKVDKPGLGGKVTVGWTEEMVGTSEVDSWKPNEQVRWASEGMMGPGTALAMEWNLETVGGKTRVRLVQSGFGESEGWDSFFEGTEVGWTYFLFNLKAYLERHAGRTRHMVWERIEVKQPRAVAWPHIASAATGIAAGSLSSLKPGAEVAWPVDGTSTRAIVEIAIPERALALRLPELGDALLFIELEGGGETFSTGWWLSVYDAAKAKAIEAPAKAAFRAAHDALSKA